MTIRIKPGTRDYLKDIGMKGETYDDVINRLVLRHAEARDAINYLETTIAELKEAKKEAEGIIDEDIIHEDCSEYRVCVSEAQSKGSEFRCNDCQIYTPDKEAED